MNLPVRSESNLFMVSKAVNLFLPNPSIMTNTIPILVGLSILKSVELHWCGKNIKCLCLV